MNTKKLIVLIILLFSVLKVSYGQDNISSLKMIHQIDSISKSRGIIYGEVKILFITSNFDQTDTDRKSLTPKRRFTFDGQFLVIENKYFNMNKLLYFIIEDASFKFYFQGY